MHTNGDAEQLRGDLDSLIARRPVALVGNAASLLSLRLGTTIDQHCVVRLNSGVPIHPASQGRKVDIHCISTQSSFIHNMSKAPWRVRLRRHYFDKALSVWMSAAEREACRCPRQAFYPMEMLHELTANLGAPPSVGSKALHMLSELTDVNIRLFGFDFKQSPTFYRRKDNLGLHDWAAERDFALGLVRRGRVELMT